MSTIAEIIGRMAATRGYTDEDLVFHAPGISEHPGGVISVVFVDSIEYPVDKARIRSIMDTDGTAVLILSDSASIQIFVLKDGSVVECPDLPPKASERSTAYVSDLVLSKQLTAMTVARMILSMHGGYDDFLPSFRAIVLMSVACDRSRLWGAIESDEDSGNSWKQCIDSAESSCPWASSELSSMRSEEAFDAYRHVLLGFKDASMSILSIGLASAYSEAVREAKSVRSLQMTTAAAFELRSLISGSTAVLTVDPVTAFLSTYPDRVQAICGYDEPDYGTVRYLAGEGSQCTPLSWVLEGSYDDILCFPPLGVSRIDSLTFENRRGANMETAVLEEAIGHAVPDGYVIALVSGRITFSSILSDFRGWIRSKADIAAIIELNGVYTGTGITCVLLVLQKKGLSGRHQTMLSRSPIDLRGRKNSVRYRLRELPISIETGEMTEDFMIQRSAMHIDLPDWEDCSGGLDASSASVDRKASSTIGDDVISFLELGTADEGSYVVVPEDVIGDVWGPESIISKVVLGDRLESAVPLFEMCTVVSGRSVPSSRYYPDGSITGVPYVRISDIRDGVLDLSKAKHVSSDESTVFSRKGDVVLSIQGTLGRTALSEGPSFIPSSQLVLLRPNDGVDPQKLLEAVRSDIFQQQMQSRSSGSVIKRVSPKDIPSMKVVI